MPILKLRLGIPNIPFLFNPDLIGGGVLSVDTSFITIDSDIFRADNHYNLMRGPELITNGIFLTDSNWSKSNSTISGGKGNLDGDGQTSLLWQDILTQNKFYNATFTVSNYNNLGEATVMNDDGVPYYTISTNGTFTVHFQHSIASGNLLIRAKDGAVYSVDNVSVTEDKTFGPELVLNGDYSQGGQNWTLGNGWSHVDGKASLVQVGSPDAADHLTQQITGLINGRTYVISFDLNITSATTTTIGISSSGAFGQLSSGDRFFTTSGTKTITGVYDSSHQSGTKYLRLVGGNNTAFTIDNVSVKEDRSLNIL